MIQSDVDFNLISLNVRGIRDSKKCTKIFHWLKSHGGKKGIYFIQETYSSLDVENQWKSRFKGKIVFSHGSRHSRGVAILLESKLECNIIEKIIDNEGRFIILKISIQGQEFILINTYFPNVEKEQLDLFEEIVKKLEGLEIDENTLIVWGGDFNFINDLKLEAIGGNAKLKSRSIENLETLKQTFDLCDIWRIRNPEAKRFTWSGYAQGKATNKQRIYRRLDYFFISDYLQPLVEDINITVAPATDHSALIMKFSALPKSRYGPSFWKLNTSLLNDENYVETVKEGILKVKKDMLEQNITDPHSRWELLKYEMRKMSISYSKAKSKRLRSEYKILEERIEKIESTDDWIENEMLVKEYENIKMQINDYSNYVTEGLIVRSKVTWFEQGEKSNKFFLNLEKHRKSKTHIRKIIDNGKELSSEKIILEKLKDYYQDIYKRKNLFTEEECFEFIESVKTTKTLNENDRKEIEGLLTIGECYKSLTKMANNKTPGNDGLPKEFYVYFWKELGEEMVSSFNYSFEKGVLSTTQRQAIVTLLEKPDKDVRFIENWRPISLINVDVKICSKALSERLTKILPKLVHPNQAAFVKGRNIEEPLRYIADLFEYSVVNEASYTLFAADFQKAFDSVEHNFIFATLRHFGFSESFIRWIRVLLENTQSCIQNNGNITDFFALERGTKQGDPISPYLFILVIEIMAEHVRRNCDIHGISLQGDSLDEIKLALFADDATFTLKDVPSLKKTLEILKTFGLFSSLKLNLEKSEVGWIGQEKALSLLPSEIKKKVNLHNDGIKILGVYFSHNQEYMKVNNFDNVFERFKATLNVWRQRHLTLYGKAIVIRSLAISKLCYVLSVLCAPLHYVKQVKNEIANFIWNGKKPKIKYSTLINDFDQGGIRLPDLETMIKANRVRWALKIRSSKKEVYWRAICEKIFEPVRGLQYLNENLDHTVLFNQIEKIPKFYKEIIQSWSEISKISINNADDILRQQIWFNRLINVKVENRCISTMVKKGVKTIDQVWIGKIPSWKKAKEKGWCESDYLLWRAVLKEIPVEWRSKLRQYYNTCSESEKDVNYVNVIYVGKNNEKYSVEKINTKLTYWMMIKWKENIPTAQRYMEKKLKNEDIDWPSVYLRIYESTIDTKLRAFQYKIINNCLFLNHKLYDFKLIDSPKCSFCSKENETMSHFFVDCDITRMFYINCFDWLKQASIFLPDLNCENVFLGVDGCVFVNFLFVLWKYVVYQCRYKQTIPVLNDFKVAIRYYEKVEYIVAKKKFKLFTHLKKYETIKKIL